MDLTDGVRSIVMPTALFGGGYSARDRECLARAMYFESNRSSREGMVAVGTVVMNRLRSGKHGDSICEVVGARGQFASGVLTKPMNDRGAPAAFEAADAVLKGERAKKVGNAMHFHTAGLRFKYRNMHYTTVAGGNAFYEKRNRNNDPVELPPEKRPGRLEQLPGVPEVLMARATTSPRAAPTRMATMRSASPRQADQPLAVRRSRAVAPAAAPTELADLGAQGNAVAAPVAAMFPPTPAPPDRMAENTPALVVTPEDPAPAMSFDVDPSDADAIGRMIASDN
jgi:hypothetical protein